MYGGGANAYLKGVLDAEKAAQVGCTGGTRKFDHVSKGGQSVQRLSRDSHSLLDLSS